MTKSEKQGGKTLLFAAFFYICGAVCTHLTLLHLPYFWDEGGYYVPAALDFYHTGSLIPVFTNAHPPLPNVVLGTLWHVFGFHILVTRLVACSFAGVGLAAVYGLASRLLGRRAGAATALVTGIYPIWFAQSSLAHADVFAAAFTLLALLLYFTSPHLVGDEGAKLGTGRRLLLLSGFFCAAVLAKETAVVQPAALGVLEGLLAWRSRHDPERSQEHRWWAGALLLCVPVLAGWFAFHFLKTGFVFGNPEFLRYNATGNLNLSHVFYALRIRLLHLFWQRNMWVPLLLAGAALLLPPRGVDRSPDEKFGLPRPLLGRIGLLVLANLVAFSLLGGALLTRYLLPVYPLLLLVCVGIWKSRTALWPLLAGLTGVAFASAIWLNPWTFFAPEDNLTYRNMVLVQQHAIDYLNAHHPDATVLTAWPVSADLTRPELGYTAHRFRVVQMENFTEPELQKAAQKPDNYDMALVFTTHYLSPSFRRSLISHPNRWESRKYRASLDLLPQQIAVRLGGQVVWEQDLDGEWAAVLQFPRGYEARSGKPLALEP